MPRVPAVCEKCGAIFPSPVEVRARNASFQGIFVSCSCGGVAHIPNGIYSAINATALAFSTGSVSEAQVNRLVAILEDARKGTLEPDQAADKIRSDVPELQTLADVLPKTRKELYTFLAVLIGILTLLFNALKPSQKASGVSEERVQQIVHESMEELYESAQPTPPVASKEHSSRPSVGRNAPCPCGSGRKYKKCCGG